MPELDLRLVYSVRYPADVIYADELGDDAVLHVAAAYQAQTTWHTRRPQEAV